MKFRVVVSIVALVSASLIGGLYGGCWPIDYADEEFREAIPKEEDLVVRIGQEDGDTVQTASIMPPLAALDPYADCDECCIEEIEGEQYYVDGEIYQMTRDAKYYVNGGLVVTMGWVSAIVNSPDPEETDLGYIWGPWQESLSRIEFRFVMDKTSAGHFSFRLEGKNINDTTDNWQTVVDGDVTTTDEPYASMGTIVLDYDKVHEIDTSHPTPDTGRIIYDFDVRDYPYTVDATFQDFQTWEGDVINAVYSYKRFDVGMAGQFSFEMQADIWPEDAPDGEIETVMIESAWVSTGQGQGEASISGGTMDLSDSVVDSVSLDECWADSDGLFYATYESNSVEYNDGTGEVSTIGCGAITTCPSI